MIKKILSYLTPITIFQTKSDLSKSIEVTWNNGELVLDSKNANYSYGSLQRILRHGLKEIGFNRIQPMQDILVLGVAGGSVIKTLVDEIGFKGKITGVELDAEMARIANAYFQLDQIKNVSLIVDDAFEFVLKTKQKYDLIIIDVFQDTHMPNFLFESFFSNRICYLLRNNGFALFNTMILNEIQNQRNKDFIAGFNAASCKIRSLPRLETHNELIIISKLES
ncbi:methyltransferase domain-containing protein [Flavobacterium sp. F-328]|uniref:Methyltransferase domain-containing protein n=1 Tax=Flavobacterium erciyesense TaxID=2825842 RepID=A0ABS5D4Q3_9FLAO|nr:methyltransferase domain-containing protein [Flavobacterium erciyesense]MBQ0909011.1 methyltransferase domain-containing protein [Flavobacterium erciyesense]